MEFIKLAPRVARAAPLPTTTGASLMKFCWRLPKQAATRRQIQRRPRVGLWSPGPNVQLNQDIVCAILARLNSASFARLTHFLRARNAPRRSGARAPLALWRRRTHPIGQSRVSRASFS